MTSFEKYVDQLHEGQSKRIRIESNPSHDDKASSSTKTGGSSPIQNPFDIKAKQNLSKMEKVSLSNLVNSNAVVQTTQAYEIAIRTKNMNNRSRQIIIGPYPITMNDLINYIDSTPDSDILQLISENITAKKGGLIIKPFTQQDVKRGNAVLREKFYNFKVGSLISIVPKCTIEITEKKAAIRTSDKYVELVMGNVTENTQFGATHIYKFIDRNQTVIEEQQRIASRGVPALDLYTKHNSPVKMMCSTGAVINSGALIANIKHIFDSNHWDDAFTLNPKNAAVIFRTLKDKLKYYDTIERDFTSIFGVAATIPPYTLMIPNEKWTVGTLPPHILFASYNSRMKDQIRPKDPLSADLQNYIPWRHVPKDLIVALVRYYIEAILNKAFSNFIAESEKNVMMQFREKQHIFYLENHDRLMYFNNGDVHGLDLTRPSFVPLPNLSVFSKPVGEKTLDNNETRKERNINFVKFVKKLAIGSAIVMPYVFPDQGTTFNNQLLVYISQNFDIMPYPITYENNIILIKKAEVKEYSTFFNALNHQFYAYAHVNNLRNVAYYAEMCSEVLYPYFKSNTIVKDLISREFSLHINGIDIKIEKILGIVGTQVAHAKIDDTDTKMNDADTTKGKSNDVIEADFEEENVTSSIDDDEEEKFMDHINTDSYDSEEPKEKTIDG